MRKSEYFWLEQFCLTMRCRNSNSQSLGLFFGAFFESNANRIAHLIRLSMLEYFNIEISDCQHASDEHRFDFEIEHCSNFTVV